MVILEPRLHRHRLCSHSCLTCTKAERGKLKGRLGARPHSAHLFCAPVSADWGQFGLEPLLGSEGTRLWRLEGQGAPSSPGQVCCVTLLFNSNASLQNMLKDTDTLWAGIFVFLKFLFLFTDVPDIWNGLCKYLLNE